MAVVDENVVVADVGEPCVAAVSTVVEVVAVAVRQLSDVVACLWVAFVVAVVASLYRPPSAARQTSRRAWSHRVALVDLVAVVVGHRLVVDAVA